MRQVGADVALIGEEERFTARQREGRFGMIFHRTWGAPYESARLPQFNARTVTR